MDGSDIVKPPAAIYYACLPDVQRLCRCTLVDLLEGRDCGVVVDPPKVRR